MIGAPWFASGTDPARAGPAGPPAAPSHRAAGATPPRLPRLAPVPASL